MNAPLPEVWLRGPLPDIPAPLQPAAHSLLQCREEAHATLADLSPAQLAARPGGAASVAYHLTHSMGSLDRLYTYARGEQLSGEQLAALRAEPAANEKPTTAATLLRNVDAAVERALSQLRATSADDILAPREVGRGRLPSTVLGLLFHGAEHTQRHLGQAVTTARVVRGTPAA
jgi:uncharacterized damage-inducible protein DinB